MEHLLELLNKVHSVSPLPIFAKETIIVQNAGMQHWLNMSIANARGISLNIDYALPSQYLWKLIRTIAYKEQVPDQSLYSREVLCWRVYQLLASDEVVNDDDFSEVVNYFRQHTGADNLAINDTANSVANSVANTVDKPAENLAKNTAAPILASLKNFDQLKQYQLAVKIADLFEQYLVFRPDWLDNWQHEKMQFSGHQSLVNSILATAANSAKNGAINPENLGSSLTSNIIWQAKLWSLLQQESEYNPQTLIKLACDNLADYQSHLPKRLSFFGINAMAPMWLDFIHQLSEFTQVHFFHLNPCVDYWGDIQTEKQMFKQIMGWLDKSQTYDEATTNGISAETADEKTNQINIALSGIDDIGLDVGNPLLANFGQQGREFLALLQQYSTFNIDVYSATEVANTETELSLLNRIQADILQLSDARRTPDRVKDDSIVITSAHSALREVQGLHDWLLHQFNQDQALTPKDILVMCPQIEHYAPYVDAVFARGWQELADDVPPLPCSIADRVSKDSDPIVIAFLDLLSLPDSRFQVSQILGLLRIKAVQDKFLLQEDDLDKISHWLADVNVHWGLDAEHKQAIVNTEQQSEQFTWQQGLSRLIRGFAFSDQAELYQAQLLLPNVEGNDALILGKLMLVLEQLQQHAQNLNRSRSALQWQSYLINLLESCFANSEQGQSSIEIILQAIEELAEYTQAASFDNQLPLAIVKEFLGQHFSQPDAGRQFMVGQITFCSMLPMRSIPFKVIAVLGLNDGDFPRQRKPQAFDLMQQTPARVGDRSRRGDDRYLFLEAIISARQALYLSYQGRNIKNNTEQQPSLILKELMAYLADGYGWQCQAQQPDCDIRQLAMQAFSVNNYRGKWPSFDGKWLALTQQNQNTQSAQADNLERTEITGQTSVAPLLLSTDHSQALMASKNLTLSFDELLKFYQHPAKYFAQQQLDLYLSDRELQLTDAEPFEADRLSAYQIRESILAILLDDNANNELETSAIASAEDKTKLLTQSARIEQLKTAIQLSGQLPDLPTTKTLIDEWHSDSETFAQALLGYQVAHISSQACQITLPIQWQGHTIQCTLTGKLPIIGEHIIAYRSSSAKPKDLMTLALYQLAVQLKQSTNVTVELGINSAVDTANEALNHVSSVLGVYFDTKAQKVNKIKRAPMDNPEGYLATLLSTYLNGQQQALLVNANIGERALKAMKRSDTFESAAFTQYWCDANDLSAPGHDPYMNYFWSTAPDISDHLALLEQIYNPIINGVVKLK